MMGDPMDHVKDDNTDPSFFQQLGFAVLAAILYGVLIIGIVWLIIWVGREHHRYDAIYSTTPTTEVYHAK